MVTATATASDGDGVYSSRGGGGRRPGRLGRRGRRWHWRWRHDRVGDDARNNRHGAPLHSCCRGASLPSLRTREGMDGQAACPERWEVAVCLRHLGRSRQACWPHSRMALSQGGPDRLGRAPDHRRSSREAWTRRMSCLREAPPVPFVCCRRGAPPAESGAEVDVNDSLKLDLMVTESLPKPRGGRSFSADSVGTIWPTWASPGPRLHSGAREGSRGRLDSTKIRYDA